DRVQAFVNSSPPHGECGALAEIVQATTLACAGRMVDATITNDTSAVPSLSEAGDIARLEAWLARKGELVRGTASQLFVEKVPQRVIEDFENKQVGTGSKKGAHGAAILTIEKSLAALPGYWIEIASDLDQIGNAVQSARIALTAAHLNRNSTLNQIAL